MFDILVYLFQNYYTPQACPQAEVLAHKLAAAGFEHDEIDEALDWLHGLAETTELCETITTTNGPSTRVYTSFEQSVLGTEAIGFITFLENTGALPAALREILIDRALAATDNPITLDQLKIIALIVLWSQQVDIDHLLFEELLTSDNSNPSH